MSSLPTIVVLTPVKNEAWILERFLSVTSQFADIIVVSDQNSTDGSRDIYRKFAKVHVIENTDTEYNEASRQRRLIGTARSLVAGPRILLALDSDEIMAADALGSAGWQRMLAAKPGTILYFEKPDLCGTPHQVIRYEEPWPLGYVDDGYQHDAKVIHSIRIPRPPYAEHLRLDDVKVLHYALTRPLAQKSKMRHYSVVENLSNTHRFYTRRTAYSLARDFSTQGTIEPSNPNWFNKWQDKGIEMFSVEDEPYGWHEFEVMKVFKRDGYRRFWIDDIWDIDWEDLRGRALARKYEGIPEFEIRPPPRVLTEILKGCDKLYRWYVSRRARRAAQAST